MPQGEHRQLGRGRARLSSRADSEAPEAKKRRILMRVVKENIFEGLARSQPTTAKKLRTEATNAERAIQA